MGSDYALNPPPPPPIHLQVKALVDRNAEMVQIIRELKAENTRLKDESEAKDRVIARQSVQLQGQPFAGQE